MIPLKDTVPTRTTPWVNYVLIGLNCLLFIYELGWGPQLPRFLHRVGLVPRLVVAGGGDGIGGILSAWLPFFSHMFFHGGWLHLLGNMLYLWIFGDNVEDRLGHGAYVFFYLWCGLVAAGVHVATNPHSMVPTIGASGAVAGVMGAYFLLYPRARVVTLVPIIFFFTIIELPAFFFLGIWFLMQLLQGMTSLAGPRQIYGGIAWWAHIGGFVCGQLLVTGMLRRHRHSSGR
ncbi:MAG: rhomboid family intramembrane serine protease [Deltaproteobacteria bacterium]|nr:rhomboid family intramembrane serine protease [Candidatus Anaeroferrophillacea bacterium]